MGYLDLKNIFLLLVGIINLIYGLIVYLRNRKSKTNFWFFLVVLSVTSWVFAMFFFRSFEIASILGARILYLSATFIPISFLYFTFIFPKDKFHFNAWQKYLLPLPFIIISIASLWPDILIKGVDIISGKENRIIFDQKIHTLYAIYIIGYFTWAYINLFKKYLNSSGILKTQISYIFTGTLISTIIGINTNLIMPYIGMFDLNWLGQVMTVVMVVLIAYAILKHHLFNIKVVVTELLTFIIWIFVLIRFFLSETIQERLINGGLLVFLIIFGILLIRSVLKEVRQREKIEELAKELETANEKLKKLDQAKSDFVTITSHQLRSPVTAIKGYASMLSEGTFGEIPEKAKMAVERIFQSSNRLVALIGDFLNLSRIERGKMEYDFKKVDLKEMIKGIIDEFKAINLTEKKNLDFSFNVSEKEDFMATIDSDKIRQVIYNLIDNAMKYTKTGFIKIFLYKEPEKRAIGLKVEDSGIGMNQEALGQIFEKFTRAEGASALHTEGTGLGLYVAKEILKAHKGKIWAESEGQGKGSTFCVELPYEK